MPLLDAGSAPQQRLRVCPSPQRVQCLHLDVKITDTAPPGRIWITADLRLSSPPERLDEGAFLIEVLQLDIKEAPEELDEIRGLCLVPMSGQGRVGALADVDEFHIVVPDYSELLVGEMLRYTLAFLGPLFPEEPVGAGAVWERELDVTFQGVRVISATRFDLLDVASEHVRLTASSRLSIPAQVIVRAGEGETATEVRSDVEATSGSIVATLAVPLSGFLPSGSICLQYDNKQTLHFGESRHVFSSTMSLELTLEEV